MGNRVRNTDTHNLLVKWEDLIRSGKGNLVIAGNTFGLDLGIKEGWLWNEGAGTFYNAISCRSQDPSSGIEIRNLKTGDTIGTATWTTNRQGYAVAWCIDSVTKQVSVDFCNPYSKPAWRLWIKNTTGSTVNYKTEDWDTSAVVSSGTLGAGQLVDIHATREQQFKTEFWSTQDDGGVPPEPTWKATRTTSIADTTYGRCCVLYAYDGDPENGVHTFRTDLPWPWNF